MKLDDLVVEQGYPLPLGAVPVSDGVNFSIFSRNATGVTLVLFEDESPGAARREIPINTPKHRLGDLWFCKIKGLCAGALYLYKVDGSYNPERGFRFNPNAGLLDPYAKALSNTSNWDLAKNLGYIKGDKAKDLSYNPGLSIDDMPRCVVIDDEFDWQGDIPLNYPLRRSVLYETHVRGLTMHPSCGKARGVAEERKGTYAGVIDMIPYFKDLGVTGIEFLPVHEFCENELPRSNPFTGAKLKNYWGYSTVAFFAPKTLYSSDKTIGGQVREFKTMVRELHKAGLEVILDVVFNHTGEGSETGPTFGFRGLDNSIYYILNDNKRYYQNYSGCGNTVNCNNPVVRGLIIDCLHYWVMHMHIDGFRFDLGSILGRNQKGALMENPPVLEQIAEDPVLRNTKIIAEAWDAGGAYQVGWFPGGRWAEWNDRFRDDARRYWRADPGNVSALATRLSGSSDLYLRDGRKPFHSINFITCHDGFTMKDLVSYNGKHNEANGEDNRDGGNNDLSCNYGYEGPSRDGGIELTRIQQMKNFFVTLLLSQGTPMILGGDEFARTQGGNNNAYCQDNEISWYDWNLQERNTGLYRFVKELIAFRLKHPCFMRPEFYTGHAGKYNAPPDVVWFDAKGELIDWDDTEYTFSYILNGTKADTLADKDDFDFFMMFNASLKSVPFTLCDLSPGKLWYQCIDTGFSPPDDFIPPETAKPLDNQKKYTLKARSCVVLFAK
ncbi:MAG: glycogen debranching protein GlgX [Spirochaetaceae bacterium]|jgi:glycogen operon protein|nr:glycogen debranching protein GlgX [Spirochaetaceae bacterium]